jgi:hypothetical protein
MFAFLIVIAALLLLVSGIIISVYVESLPERKRRQQLQASQKAFNDETMRLIPYIKGSTVAAV